MSKLSKLKQEAYLAGKKRNWEEAIQIYERIIAIDKNNPTLINELGDICLRMGDEQRSVEHFLTAAANYRSTGLQNNAVAIYKKILRYDPNNLNAHWYLAEIRAAQGRDGEGEEHVLRFLAEADRLSGDLRELYLKRCVKLLGLYPARPLVLDKLGQIFRHWSLPLEEARIGCLKACLAFDEGKREEAGNAVQSLIAAQPDVTNYPEYAAWRQRQEPVSSRRHSYHDVNALNLESSGEPAESVRQSGEDCLSAQEPGDGPQRPPAVRRGRQPRPEPEPAPITPPQQDEEGRIEIDLDGDLSFAGLLDEFQVPEDRETGADEPSEGSAAGSGDDAGDSVDLLAEILAEGGPDLHAAAAQQADTIASEIGAQVGGGGEAEDPASQYELGMVYLEMGMFEQAVKCFACAAESPAHSLRSHEMWGISLMRMQKCEQAIEIFRQGLEIPVESAAAQLGLVYHLGRALEETGDVDAARDCYGRAHDMSPDFLDVAKRLANLATVH